jgi:tetratricopeptide (TPR) repeat protein
MAALTTQQSAAQMVAEGQRHHLAGRLPEAEAGYLEALRLSPKNADALHYLGVIRQQQNDSAAAVKLIARAIKQRPDSVEMHLNLGAAYRTLGDPQRSVFAYRKALVLAPGMPEAHFNMAHSLRDAGEFEAAVKSYEIYIKARPDEAQAYLGLGCALVGVPRYDEAMAAFDTAITLDPDYAEVYDKIGTLQAELGRFHTAAVFLETATALAPAEPEWRMDLAFTLLRLERFAEGWDAFETRFDRVTDAIVRRPCPPAYWQGEPLAGKTILVWMEQGVGDQIMLASILPDLFAQAGKCIIECAPRLVPVFARSFPEATVVANSNLAQAATPPEGIDYQIAGGSLGRYFRSTLEQFPRQQGYLKADMGKAAALRARYEALAGGRRIVGLSWRSSNSSEAAAKTASLMGLRPILESSDIFFVNLQYGNCRADLAQAREECGAEIYHDPEIDPLKNMDDFFAQVQAMDLVVTTSNTTAHVAGSLNRPTLLMLPAGKGLLWYWFARCTDSLWYPALRLVRAPSHETSCPWWEATAAEAATLLQKWRDSGRLQ